MAMEMSGALTKVCHGSSGKYPGFGLYRQKGRESKMRGENSGGFTNDQSPQGGAYSGYLLDQMSKSPLFPGGGGEGVVTNDYCIIVSVVM